MTDIGRSCVPALCRPTGTYICVKHLIICAHMSYVICTVTYGGGGGEGGHLINLCKSLCRSM